MFVEGRVIGQKLKKSTIIKHEEKERQKRLKKWRAQNKKRTKKSKEALIRIKKLALCQKIGERPFISLEAAEQVFTHIKDGLSAMGYSEVYASGAIRRKVPRISSIVVVISHPTKPLKAYFRPEFIQTMALRGYITSDPGTVKSNGYTFAFSIEGIPLFVYFTDPSVLGACLMHTTGNINFLKKISMIARKDKTTLRLSGLFSSGELLPSATEKDIFYMLDLPDIPAELRCLSYKDSINNIKNNIDKDKATM